MGNSARIGSSVLKSTMLAPVGGVAQSSGRPLVANEGPSSSAAGASDAFGFSDAQAAAAAPSLPSSSGLMLPSHLTKVPMVCWCARGANTPRIVLPHTHTRALYNLSIVRCFHVQKPIFAPALGSALGSSSSLGLSTPGPAAMMRSRALLKQQQQQVGSSVPISSSSSSSSSSVGSSAAAAAPQQQPQHAGGATPALPVMMAQHQNPHRALVGGVGGGGTSALNRVAAASNSSSSSSSSSSSGLTAPTPSMMHLHPLLPKTPAPNKLGAARRPRRGEAIFAVSQNGSPLESIPAHTSSSSSSTSSSAVAAGAPSAATAVGAGGGGGGVSVALHPSVASTAAVGGGVILSLTDEAGAAEAVALRGADAVMSAIEAMEVRIQRVLESNSVSLPSRQWR